LNQFHGFGPGLVDFYLALEQHNNREWFQANRARYEAEIGSPLKALAQELESQYPPVKVFRPFRNTRFWPELPPLNEHASLVANAGDVAILYLRIDADGMLITGGSHQLDRAQISHFRSIVATDKGAARVRSLLAEAAAAGFSISEEFSLKTAPRGYSRDHPHIDLLRLRSLSLGRHYSPGPWLATRESLDLIASGWQTMMPWVRWLRANLDFAQLN